MSPKYRLFSRFNQISVNHGYEPQSKLWKLIPQQAAGYHTLRYTGLFTVPIPIRFALASEKLVTAVTNFVHALIPFIGIWNWNFTANLPLFLPEGKSFTFTGKENHGLAR